MCSRRSAGVRGKATIWSRALVSCAMASISGPLLWRALDDRAAPSAMRASLRGRPEPRMERQQWDFALRLRFPLPAQPSSFPPQQRDAVSALDYVLPYALRQRLIAGDAVDQGSN